QQFWFFPSHALRAHATKEQFTTAFTIEQFEPAFRLPCRRYRSFVTHVTLNIEPANWTAHTAKLSGYSSLAIRRTEEPLDAAKEGVGAERRGLRLGITKP